MSNLFASKVDDGYGGFQYAFHPLSYVILIALVLVLLLIIASISKKEKKQLFNTKQLVFSAIAMGLAMLTSYLELYSFPAGGSITLCSMLFITIIGYWYGPKIGITSAVAYGLLQLIVKPYVVSIPQMLFDYILAFGALGLAGFFSNKKYGVIKGYVTGVLGRFVFATISGVIFFADWAPEGTNVWIYSMSYNGLYLVAEGAITLAVLALPPVYYAFAQVKKLALE